MILANKEFRNVLYRIPRELLTSSRHFRRSSTALSREIAERKHKSWVVLLLSPALHGPNLWLSFKLLRVSMPHKWKREKNSYLLACNKLIPYAVEGAQDPMLWQPEAIANQFATEKGKHDGILPPMARACLFLTAHSPTPFRPGFKSVPSALASCKSEKGRTGPEFSLTFPAGSQLNNRKRIHRMGLRLS